MSEQVTIGWTSFQDGTFELIVKDPATHEETTLKGTCTDAQSDLVNRLFPPCVFVTYAPVAK